MNNDISSTPIVKKTLYEGPGIPPPPSKEKDSLITKFANHIFHGGKFSLDLVQKDIIKAIFVKLDPCLLQLFQDQLQLELEHLATMPPKNDSERLVWNAFLGNILSILPFSYPQNNQRMTIPCLKEGLCERVEYKIEVLLLEEPDVPSPMTALGLTPTHDKTAKPFLSFLGTTYPAGSGFLASIMTDFHPNRSVGEHTYRYAKPIIDSWLKDKHHVHIVGTSLGGAMAFHTLKDNYRILERIDVYNPPGLYPESWANDFNEGCEIHIYQQPLDIVPMMGAWPHGKKVNLYHVAPVTAFPSTNRLTAHLRAYSGGPKIKITREDPLQENELFARKFLTFLHRYLSPCLIYYSCKLLYALYKFCQKSRY
jgi:hypothetical protein